MLLRRALNLVLAVTAARVISIAAFDEIIAAPQFDGWISLFYLPAGVNMIAMLAGGYWAAIGVGLGSLVWNLLTKQLGFLEITAMSLTPALSCVLALMVFRSIVKRPVEGVWPSINLLDVLGFVIIYGLANAGLHHVAFRLFFESGVFSVQSYFVMLVGDISGSLGAFLMLNLLASAGMEIMKRRGRFG